MKNSFCLLGTAFLLLISPLRAYVSIMPDYENEGFPRQYEPGETLTFLLEGTVPPAGSYQWLHDDAAIPGATGQSLTLVNLSSPDSGNYRLRVTNGTTIELSATLTINVLPFPTSPFDPTFTALFPSEATDASILGVLADGSVLVRSSFPNPARDSILRFAVDGTLVRQFSILSPSDEVSVLAVYPDGRLVTANPSRSYRLSATGEVEPLSLPAGFDSSKPLTAAALQSDGRLLIAQGSLVARLNLDDSLDPSFNYSPALASSLTANHVVKYLTPDGTGRLYITATSSESSRWPFCFRLLSDGTRDPSFATVQGSDVLGFEPYPLSDGRVLFRGVDEYGTYLALSSASGGSPLLSSWPAHIQLWYASRRTSLTVDPTGRVFYVDQNGTIRRANLTATTWEEDPTFYAGLSSATAVVFLPNGNLFATGWFDPNETNPRLARLRSTDSVSYPPVSSIARKVELLRKGRAVTFTSSVEGTGPFTYQWLGLDGQPLPTDSESSTLVIPSLELAHFGRYQLRVTGPGGVSALSDVVGLSMPLGESFLSNLSGRALSGTGENTIIAGCAAVTYPYRSTLPVLLRGAGPALEPLGVNAPLPNPTLEVHDATGAIVATNDQWSVDSSIAAEASAVGAFGFTQGSDDAALLQALPAGTSTIMLKDQGQSAGVGLLEIYQRFPYGDEDNHDSLALTNLSFRARTASGEATTIAGFVITDPYGFGRSARVLLRAVGPTLSDQGIAHPIANPILTVYDSAGKLVAQNDDWSLARATEPSAPADIAAAAKQVGAFNLPTDSKDAALLLDLPAGAYTMHATGGSGVVLLEIYLVP